MGRVAGRFFRTLVLLAACGDNVHVDRVLAFSRTIGYRHADSIDQGIAILPTVLGRDNIAIDFTEDPTALHDLMRYRAVMFLYTQGDDIVDDDGKAAIEVFVRRGGGWIGIHSAGSSETQWPFYQAMLVEPSIGHPAIQPAIVHVEDRTHPATARLPDGPWSATDEWYNFAANPRQPGVRVLATIDESSYTGGTLGDDHPLVWCHERFGGRVFYSELGHVAVRWQEPAFVALVEGGVRWVLRRE
jgi:type 1 glutamine amidotransferase